MKKIRIAQIGTSAYTHSNNTWQGLKRHNELFEVVGYALPENEKERLPHKIPHFNGFSEMTVEEILSDPTIDAVAVETDEIYLTKYALMVAKAGKHLHMEKPGGISLKDFEELVRIIKEKNLVFSTGYMYRFNPKIIEALQKINNGDLGEIYSVEAHMDCIHPTKVRQWLQGFPGGMMFYLGCHLVDLIYRIQGEPLEVLPLNCSTGFDDVTADDYGMAVLKYKNGVSFAKTCAEEYGGFLRRQLVICGNKGTIEINPLETSVDGEILYTVMKESHNSSWRVQGEITQTEPFNRYDAMLKNFAERINGKEEKIYTPDYELKLFKLILKCCGEEI